MHPATRPPQDVTPALDIPRTRRVRAFLLGGLLVAIALSTMYATAAAFDHPAQPVTSPSPSLDPIFATATYLVGRATEMARGTAVTPVQQIAATVSLDPMLLTATYIVQRATDAELATQQTNPSRTPAPTLTTEEAEVLRLRWKAELESAAGFTHPIFDQITYNLILDDWKWIWTGWDPHNISLDPQTHRITYEESTYVAILHIWGGLFPSPLLVFRLTGNDVTLIFHSRSTPYYWDSEGFADRNANGYPELALGGYSGGNCGGFTISLLEIRPSDELVNVAPEVSGEVNLNEWVDVDNDGLLEIKGFDRVGIPLYGVSCPELQIIHLYRWNGTAYEDVTAEYGAAYYPNLETYWDSIEPSEGCLLPDYAMYEMLVGSIALGQLQEAWSRLWDSLQWGECSGAVLVEHASEMTDLLTWVGEYLQQENVE